ncbi:Zn-dependent hydrolase [Bacillus sp. IITD106]|nr:Zn-dependent hydrolase [Bacillus sp. IITD106]
MGLTVESKEFQQVLHNLRLENMSLSTELQKRVIRLVNSDVTITPELIKRIVQHGKI